MDWVVEQMALKEGDSWMKEQYAQFCNHKNSYKQLKMNYWLDKIKKERAGL